MNIAHVNMNKFNGMKNIDITKVYTPEFIEKIKRKVFTMKVFHDDTCDFYKNKGDCNCKPETVTEEV